MFRLGFFALVIGTVPLRRGWAELQKDRNMTANWAEERRLRERAEIAARKKIDAEKRDPELEQCVVAYHAHRVDGGQMRFEDFRRLWYTTRETKDGG